MDDGSSLTMETIGMEWQRCPFEWGIEQYVTIITEQGHRLILMNVARIVEPYSHAGKIVREPVRTADLGVYGGHNIDPEKENAARKATDAIGLTKPEDNQE